MTREEELQQFAEQNTKGLYLDRHNLIQMVKQGAEWADQHPHWIPVEERLPEDNTQVLAYNGKFNEVHLVDYSSGIFEDFYGPFSKGVITHWMPLPKAPRKEDKK